MNKSGSFRKKKINFTQVSNFVLLDENLSLKAKGLFSLIQHYVTIPDFILYKNTLKKACKEKEKAFDSAWNELKKAGYLLQHKMRDSESKRFYYEYELMDKPHPQKPHVEKAGGGKARCGKRGVYNKTDFSNTDLNNNYIKDTELYVDLDSQPDRGHYKNEIEFEKHLEIINADNETMLALNSFYSYYQLEHSGLNHYRLSLKELLEVAENTKLMIEHLKSYEGDIKIFDYIDVYFKINSNHSLKAFSNIKTFNYIMSTYFKEFVDTETYYDTGGNVREDIDC